MKHLPLILILFSLGTGTNLFAQKDSLLSALGYYELIKSDKASLSDTTIIEQINQSVTYYAYVDPKRCEDLALAGYKLSKKIGYEHGVAVGLKLIGDAKMLQDDLDSAIMYIDKSISYSRKHGFYRVEMEGYNSKGNGHFYKGEYEDALDMYFSSAEISEKHFDTEVSGNYGSIGLVFRVIGNNDKSEEYLQKGYQLAKLYKDTTDLLFILNNLGIVAKNKGELLKSLDYYNEGLTLAILTNNLRREGEIVYNSSNVYFKLGDTLTAMKCLERSSEITEAIGNSRDLAIEHQNLGHLYYELGQLKKAEYHSRLAVENSIKSQYWEAEIEARHVMANILFATGRYKAAFVELNLVQHISDSINLKEVNSVAVELENGYLQEKKDLADSLQNEKNLLESDYQKKLSDEKVKAKDNLLWGATAIIFLVILGLILLFRSNKKVKLKNIVITERNNIITVQKREIEEVHKEITDSINYAQRIQNALISGNVEWDKISLDHSILFMPKDVVSGDFYWAYHSEEENISIWVTADCTGHGVPGAFMSMLGISFLNEIVAEGGNRNGGEILDIMRQKIVKALAQKGGDYQQKDGMDLTLCIWHKNENKLEFTGANNPLWIIRKSEVEAISNVKSTLQQNDFSLYDLATNKMPVGFQSDHQEKFKSQIIQLHQGDLIISFTDGFADQFGGEKGKKFKYKPFKETLLALQGKPVKLYASVLMNSFESWKGNLEQVDDVCVIAVQI